MESGQQQDEELERFKPDVCGIRPHCSNIQNGPGMFSDTNPDQDSLVQSGILWDFSDPGRGPGQVHWGTSASVQGPGARSAELWVGGSSGRSRGLGL